MSGSERQESSLLQISIDSPVDVHFCSNLCSIALWRSVESQTLPGKKGFCFEKIH